MKDHVSLGSQPQYRPQAASAQIAPQITANVQIGNASAWIRKVVRSRPSASGSRPPSVYGNRTLPSSYPVRTRVSAAATNPTRKIPDAVTAAVTWIFSQYELSAGTSGATFVYSSAASPVSASPARPASAATRAFSASPRPAPAGGPSPSTSSSISSMPSISSTSAGGPAAPIRSPVPTSSRVATRPTTDREPNAYSTAWASMASVYPRIAYTRSWSESEASSPSIRHQAPPSTTCSPGSYRTDSAVHGRVPRNSTVLPSSSRADSPGRSRSGSGATARSRPVSIWRWSSV